MSPTFLDDVICLFTVLHFLKKEQYDLCSYLLIPKISMNFRIIIPKISINFGIRLFFAIFASK